jgi:DNA-binding CsgD family transcriptional regulator
MKNNEVHKKVTSFISEIVNKDNYLNTENKWLPIKNMLQTKEFKFLVSHINGFFFIYNYVEGYYEYFSDNIKSELGHDPQGFIGKEGVLAVFNILPDDHARMFPEIMKEILIYISQNSSSETGATYRFTNCIKMKDIYDKYQWFLLDTHVIQTDTNGFPVRTFISATNINSFKKDELMYYNVLKKDESGIYKVVHQGCYNERKEEFELTDRELEIIRYIGEGYTNEKIAESLFISLNTVKTHRKNILKKTNCKGTAELTKLAFVRGLV